MSEHDEFSRRLQSRRIEKKLSQRSFAKAVGISSTYLSQIERGVLPPPANDKIMAIAKLLDENADELMLLAGRVPPDIQAIILKNPAEVCGFLRGGTKDFSREDWWSFNKGFYQAYMQPRTTAKKDGFLKGTWRLEIKVTEEQFCAFERAGGIDLDLAAREGLEQLLNDNDFERKCYEAGVTVRDVIERAKKMENMAADMGQTFTCQTALDKAIALRLTKHPHWKEMCGFDSVKFASLRYFLKQISSNLMHVHVNRDGRDKDVALDALFRGLSRIYDDATKRGRTGRRMGKSNFVEAILLAFPKASPFILSRDAITRRLSRLKEKLVEPTDETST
ncbi:MAG: helix-turn-helix transcriptional regulator [Alphaproteobacteria bacterium]|nr:helix-turn-helix transcriptional regulator [Alphaproteobacteria bacterium]